MHMIVHVFVWRLFKCSVYLRAASIYGNTVYNYIHVPVIGNLMLIWRVLCMV